jgi:hypothetical protein
LIGFLSNLKGGYELKGYSWYEVFRHYARTLFLYNFITRPRTRILSDIYSRLRAWSAGVSARDRESVESTNVNVSILSKYSNDGVKKKTSAAIASLFKRLEPQLKLLEQGGSMFGGEPDVYLLLGQFDKRPYLEFAKKWNGKSPIIVSGGIGRGTENLKTSITKDKAYISSLPWSAKLKWDFLSARKSTTEAEIIEFLLNQAGISSANIILEKDSTNTPENIITDRDRFPAGAPGLSDGRDVSSEADRRRRMEDQSRENELDL